MTRERYVELQHRIDELDRTIEHLQERKKELTDEQLEIIVGTGAIEDGEWSADDEDQTPSMTQVIKDKIDELSTEFDEGAPYELVVSELARERDDDKEVIEDEIKQLKTIGEAYEPRADHLRCV